MPHRSTWNFLCPVSVVMTLAGQVLLVRISLECDHGLGICQRREKLRCSHSQERTSIQMKYQTNHRTTASYERPHIYITLETGATSYTTEKKNVMFTCSGYTLDYVHGRCWWLTIEKPASCMTFAWRDMDWKWCRFLQRYEYVTL